MKSTLLTTLFSLAILVASACNPVNKQEKVPATELSPETLSNTPPSTTWPIDLAEVSYNPQDSIQVVAMLAQGKKLPKDSVLTLYYANQLIHIPYVAATLEVHPEERLTINLTQLDCTTLIENVLAMSLATRRGDGSFECFCHWLRTIRYRHGEIDGYASRNHYFTQWVKSNTQLGIVSELQGEDVPEHYPFLSTRKTDLHFMTSNPSKYPLLKKEKMEGKNIEPGSQTSFIRQYEEEYNGKPIRYIPKRLLNQGKEKLGTIRDGDIVALVTNKDGLDVTHLGLAVWGQDGLLHLLNASSIYHKVLIDPTPLYQYLNKRNYLLGIRVIREVES